MPKCKQEVKKSCPPFQNLLGVSNHLNCFRLDPKDLDVLLSEIVLLNTRAELYLRFVRRRLTVSDISCYQTFSNS